MNIQLELSKLNFHSFTHDFSDALDPLCPLNDGIEDTKHFLLLCHAYDEDRNDLLNSVDAILQPHGLTSLSIFHFIFHFIFNFLGMVAPQLKRNRFTGGHAFKYSKNLINNLQLMYTNKTLR